MRATPALYGFALAIVERELWTTLPTRDCIAIHATAGFLAAIGLFMWAVSR